MTPAIRQRTLIVIDPLECGGASFGRTLTRLDPGQHELTLMVLATYPRDRGSEGRFSQGLEDPAFSFADRALAEYSSRARSAGFEVDGWVAPRRQSRIEAEVQANGRFDRVLAVSPSSTWRRIRGADISRLVARYQPAPVDVACQN
ncbi:MAG TPA: hypothetical protein VLB85_10255 [Acidimicrobiia bacterium]|nr:hypothetical protein [Acidimicrobiia bacterium]